MTGRKEEPGGHGEEREPTLPADEEAAWAQIVAGYGERPEVPGDARWTDADDRNGDDGPGQGEDARDDRPGPGGHGGGTDGPDARDGGEPEKTGPADRPVRSFTVYPAGTGPSRRSRSTGNGCTFFCHPGGSCPPRATFFARPGGNCATFGL